jgi:hypothetical protein
MIIYHGISLILLSFVVLLVGMFKPKWILFWVDTPSRMVIAAISMALFMIGFTLYGSGTKEKKELEQKQAATVKIEKTVSDTPAPTQSKPATPPPAPAQAPETSANELRP